MKIIKVKNYEELSQKAAQLVAKLMHKKPDATLGLATGSTPIGLYKQLIA
ncbi:MAG TPA: glucosamine-6-phosphate deaminase, partial [Bacilli bacterium]|nr:glucosamine-6-phosphate deaminase [Bacilli bacterium]